METNDNEVIFQVARRKKKKSDMNIDLTSISLIIVGIVLAIIVYSSELGAIGSFIKFGILGGFFGKVTMAIPLLLIVLRNLCDF